LRGRGRPRRLLRALKLDTIGQCAMQLAVTVRARMHFADQCSKDAPAYLLADASCTSQGRPTTSPARYSGVSPARYSGVFALRSCYVCSARLVPSVMHPHVCVTVLLCVQRKTPRLRPQRDTLTCWQGCDGGHHTADALELVRFRGLGGAPLGPGGQHVG